MTKLFSIVSIAITLLSPSLLFAETTIFGMPAYTRHFENAEDGINPWRPVETLVEAEYSYRLRIWLVKETDRYYEGSTVTLRFINKAGEVITEFPTRMGPFVYSQSGQTILFCEIDGYDGTLDSYLYSLDGKELKRLSSRGFADECGVSGDSKLYWQKFSIVEDGNPISVIRFLDYHGSLVKEVQLNEPGVVKLRHGTKSYEFYFSKPKFPA